MAHSPGSAERRARLIREMAKQSDPINSSGPSSIASDPPIHIHADTESQQLPALPGPQSTNYATHPRREPDFQINTSALRRAFPDFSQNGSLASSSDASIEFGRGLRPGSGNARPMSEPSADVTENISFDFGDGKRYRVMGTPPARPKKLAKEVSNKRSVSQKENQDPMATTENKPYSHQPRASQVNRRSLAEMNPSVESDNTGSLHGDGQNVNTRNTRFRIATDSKSTKPILTVPLSQHATTKSGNSAGGTIQSFILPDMPNITELVSGVRQDGTPMFSRTPKSRGNVGGPSSLRKSLNNHYNHAQIISVPTSAEEKALHLSLQLLQEKVASLEAEKATSQQRETEDEIEILQLRSRLEEIDHARQTDSGVGFDAEETKTRDDDFERSRFESSIKTFQERLDRANRKLTTSATTIQNLTRDRDAAHTQLARAQLNSEELKSECNSIQGEIKGIKNELSRVTKKHEKRIEALTLQEIDLRAKIGRREKAVHEMGYLAKEIWRARNAMNISSTRHNAATRAAPKAEDFDDRDDKHQVHGQANSTSLQRQRPQSVTSKRRVSASKVNFYETQDTQKGEKKVRRKSSTNFRTNDQDFAAGATYESFMEGDEIVKLKEILEQDRAKLAEHDSSRATQVPRKSSMKDLTGNLSIDLTQPTKTNGAVHSRNTRDDDPLTNELHWSSRDAPGRENTQTSVFSKQSGSRRRRSAQEMDDDMTSALILPDITLAGNAMNDEQQAGNKQTYTVHKPVAVSERDAPTNGDDITLRPAQEPAIALATVLQGLQDELTRLRTQLAQQEALYNQYDPALGKRKRKMVFDKIRRLLGAVETRSDQIYALYDVLEGQKARGDTMQQEEVEVTLRDIGIDVAAFHQKKQASTTKKARTQGGFDGAQSEESEDDGLSEASEVYDPEDVWEGFEPTQSQTLGSMRAWGVAT